jgi:hypothetical protein
VFFLRIQILPESQPGEVNIPEQGLKSRDIEKKVHEMRGGKVEIVPAEQPKPEEKPEAKPEAKPEPKAEEKPEEVKE